MARESAASLSLFPAELWKVTTPELVALPMLALAEADTIPAPPSAKVLTSQDSVLLCCICVLAAASRVEVSTY